MLDYIEYIIGIEYQKESLANIDSSLKRLTNIKHFYYVAPQNKINPIFDQVLFIYHEGLY